MNAPSTICSKCKSDNSKAIAKGACSCPVCGFWLDSDSGLAGLDSMPASRWKLWLSFWLFFLGTPVMFLMGSAFHPSWIDWAGLIAAMVGAGCTLAKLFAKKTWTFVVLSIVFSICVFGAYALAYGALLFYIISHWRC